jgi:hypothetical protein
MKTLYLDGARCTEIMLDGPALRVRTPGRADGLYPLGRVSRVVVCGAADWRTEALLACADRGIPVTFVGRDGRARAWLVPMLPRPMPLTERVQELLARSDGTSRYQDWRRHTERKMILRVLGELRLRVADLRPERAAEELLNRLTFPGGPAAATRVLHFWDGLLAGRAAGLLMQAGLDGTLFGACPERWSLAADLVRLAGWNHYVWLASVRQLSDPAGLDPDAPDFRRRAIDFFEQRASEVDRTLRGLLHQFSVWLDNLP